MSRQVTALPPVHALHRTLVPVATLCFIATLITDLVYAHTANMLWADMSDWSLSIGVIVFAVLIVVGLIGLLIDPEQRQLRLAWLHFALNVAALVLAFLNALIHTRDAYTSVVPAGLTLSALVVVLLLVTGWTGWAVSYRRDQPIGVDRQT